MKTIFATPYELIRIAQGQPLVMFTTDGEPIQVSVPSVLEYIEAAKELDRTLRARGWDTLGVPTVAEIGDLLQTLPEGD